MAAIQDIFTKYYNQCEKEYALANHARKAAWNIINCRTEAMGGHIQKCPDGHFYRVWYNSCKHRSCPQCTGMQKEEWKRKQTAKVLDTHHHHAVFTIPHELNELWLLNPKKITGILFKSVKEALFNMLSNKKFLGATPGMIATLQTWGENLAFHPHLHCLITGGGVTKAENWKESKENYLLPVQELMKVFRGKFLDEIHNTVYNGEMEIPSNKNYYETHEMLRKERKKDWNVNIDREAVYGNGVIKYLGDYIKGGPISNRRIIFYNEKEVKFYYKDNKDGRKRKIMTLRTEEFIRRFLLHVPRPHLKVVRHYGLYASCKKEGLNRCRKLLGQDGVKDIENLKWQDYCESEGKNDKSICPECGKKLIKGQEFKSGSLALLLIILGKKLSDDLILKDRELIA
ncbi:IS91 family transposase [Natroniella sp. ANB-PHB2]|uniref:IS91 family transposase n=1 Tax=Natroniella sp. ANB-PHB2 TaxID=3384444 RepID=UPI0038D3535F